MDHYGPSPQLSDAPLGKNLLLCFWDHTDQDAPPQHNAEPVLGTRAPGGFPGGYFSGSWLCSLSVFSELPRHKPTSMKKRLPFSEEKGKRLTYWKGNLGTIRVVFP